MSGRHLKSPILPGSAIGVLGSGQLGRMFALAARRMGYRVHTYSPEDDTPTGQVADVEITAPYSDLGAVRAKAFLRDSGFPVTAFRRVGTPDELSAALSELGYPAILKTAGFGYDGKG